MYRLPAPEPTDCLNSTWFHGQRTLRQRPSRPPTWEQLWEQPRGVARPRRGRAAKGAARSQSGCIKRVGPRRRIAGRAPPRPNGRAPCIHLRLPVPGGAAAGRPRGVPPRFLQQVLLQRCSRAGEAAAAYRADSGDHRAPKVGHDVPARGAHQAARGESGQEQGEGPSPSQLQAACPAAAAAQHQPARRPRLLGRTPRQAGAHLRRPRMAPPPPAQQHRGPDSRSPPRPAPHRRRSCTTLTASLTRWSRPRGTLQSGRQKRCRWPRRTLRSRARPWRRCWMARWAPLRQLQLPQRGAAQLPSGLGRAVPAAQPAHGTWRLVPAQRRAAQRRAAHRRPQPCSASGGAPAFDCRLPSCRCCWRARPATSWCPARRAASSSGWPCRSRLVHCPALLPCSR